jgi:Pyruvate/2-oxoacid:ferredoxin oxidoreductase delta subunit
MPYEHLTCYFLSGTGNSFRAARWLAEAAEAQGATTDVVPIERAHPRCDLQPGPQQLVGIYHPAHGLMPPWSMIKFLLRMPMGRGAHAAVLCTRGGIRVGRLVLPGAAGLGVFFPLLVLALKGYRVRGGLGIDMPINTINLHWGLRSSNVEFIKAWGRRRHERFAAAILAGGRFWRPLNLIWEFLWPAVLLWFVPIFPIVYLLIGRTAMAKMMFADTRCNGCGLCAKYCPNQAIVMKGAKPRFPFWTHRCEACMRCMGYCRPHAVEAGHLWLAIAIMGTLVLTADSLAGLLAKFGLSLARPALEVISFLLTYAALVLFYYVFWAMQRLPPLHALWSFATITRFYRRRFHDPETQLNDMT